jgi:DNA-binding CsgD family transcriptional regulator/DNA-binding transcriptional ArsR family regulator
VYGRIDVARERGFTRLVGRERELELLSHCFEMVRSGRGQAISVIGDAGLGKSRLLYEYRQALAGEPLIWLDGRCSPYGTALAYHPIVDLLKQLFRIDNSDSDADIRRRVHQGLAALHADPETAPYLLHLLAVEVHDYLPQGLSPEALKQRIFEAVRTLLLACAAQHPLVVAIEDLHWVDNATEEWLTFLLDQIAASRIMLLLTYRPDFASTWSRKSYHSVITVTRLSQDDSYRLLTALLGTMSIHDDLATWVLDKAEGVPFFLEELVRSLRETHAIDWHDSQWQLTVQDTTWQIPTTVDEVLMARIDRLPEGAKSVLQMGSVIGREFSGELLRELSGLTDRELTAHLAALTEAELIYAGGLPSRPTYLFKHAFTQEAAYRSLLTPRRRSWHHRVAETLETLFPDRLEEYYGPLAHHLMEAGQDGDAGKAMTYAVRAGDRNMALPAYAEAVGFYQMALEACARQEQVDEAQRCELLLTLGAAQKKAGKYAQALDTIQHAAHCAKSFGWSEALARAALEAEQVTWYSSLPAESAIRLLKAALDELPAADSALRARVLGSSAGALVWTGQLQPATERAQQAVDMARRVGEPSALASSLRSQLGIPWQPEEVEQRLTSATEMLHLAQEMNDGELICNARYWRLHALLEIGDAQEWDADMDTLARFAEELQQLHFMRNAKGFQAMRALMQGNFADSEALAQQALAIGQRMQSEHVPGIFGLQMFSIRREQGRLQELEPVVKYFVQQHGVASTWRPGLALIYSELGRQREARREFEHLAQHDFADFPRDGLWLACMTYLAEVCTYLGDATRAAMLYQLLLPYAGRAIVVGGQVACYGAASRYLGMLATTMEHWPEAEQHFEAALTMNAKMGAQTWLAHTQHDYATMLFTRNQPGDAEQAAGLLQDASATARELGMRALEDRIAARSSPNTISSSPPSLIDLDDLSPREIDVLRLLAAGKSNREIADALFISRNTVSTHVRNILTKTGCTNRTEAATYALRHGLSEA